MKLSDGDIANLVNELCGDVYPYGETNHDDEIFDNITKILNVADSLICRVGNYAINNENRGLLSVERCKFRAYEMLETISEHIQEYMESYNEYLELDEEEKCEDFIQE